MSEGSLRPVRPGERIPVLDALRGFALFGILLINMRWFTAWIYMPDAARAELVTPLGDALWFVHDWLVLHKFYSLFSLLFGIGFAIQLVRAAERDRPIGGLYARRMLLLFLFGLAHLLLLYQWDILHLYAVCGLVLLAFRRLDRSALVLGALLIAVPPVIQRVLIVESGGTLDPQLAFEEWGRGVMTGWGYDVGRAPWHVPHEGSWRDVLLQNLSNSVYRIADILERGFFFQVLGTFLIGLWTGRRLMEGRLADEPRFLRRICGWGLAIGLPLNWVLASMLESGVEPYTGEQVRLEIVRALGVTPLALGYAAGFALLWRLAPGRRVLRSLVPAGRAALTNYTGQSVLAVFLFYGAGLGLAGTMGPAGWTAATIGIFGFQMAASAAWLRIFRYGPLEWLWRRLTYPGRLRAPGPTDPAPPASDDRPVAGTHFPADSTSSTAPDASS